jgi:hypothetical protein
MKLQKLFINDQEIEVEINNNNSITITKHEYAQLIGDIVFYDNQIDAVIELLQQAKKQLDK